MDFLKYVGFILAIVVISAIIYYVHVKQMRELRAECEHYKMKYQASERYVRVVKSQLADARSELRRLESRNSREG